MSDDHMTEFLGAQDPGSEWNPSLEPGPAAAAESPAPRKQKPSTAAAEKRKLRNRLSQQAFRTRQNLEIAELKQRLAQFDGSESQRNERIAKDNQALRKRLWQCEKKLRSLQATLQNVLDSIVEARENGFSDHNQCKESETPSLQHADEESASSSSTQPFPFLGGHSYHDSTTRFLDADLDFGFGDSLDISTADSSMPDTLGDYISDLTTFDSSVEGSIDCATISKTTMDMAQPQIEYPAIPVTDNDTNIEHMEQVMTGTYKSGVPRSLPCTTYPQASMAISRYCQHIDAYENSLMTSRMMDKNGMDVKRLTRIISAVLSSFIKTAWSSMESWMQYTQGKDSMAKLTAWRVAPSLDTLAEVPTFYRPTPLQTAVPHPAIIDWCIFPFLRNKLIQYHSSDPALDDICGDIGLAYVVQADLSDLVVGAQSLLVNLSVHEIVQGMIHDPELVDADGRSECNSEAILPAPNLHVLLHTKEYSWALYRRLKVGQGPGRYQIDTSLFVKYPHLYEPDENIANGVPLRSMNSIPWPVPRPLDQVAMDNYLREACIMSY